MGQKTITNSLQTNGVLLTDEWCRFLKENNFLVGSAWMARKISMTAIDGIGRAKELLIRRCGVSSFCKNIRSNIMCSPVSPVRPQQPLEVYHFLKRKGLNSSSSRQSWNGCPTP